MAKSTEMAAVPGAPLWYDGLVPKFDGVNKTYTSSKWAQDVEDHAEIMQWTPTQTLIVARRSLTGVAAMWLKTEKIHRTFEELKSALIKEFPDSINSKEAHELLSSRKKRKEESYYEYMLSMKELAKRGKIADYVAIQYVVEGITDYESNKAVLYGATTYSALKDKLLVYETMKKNAAKAAGRRAAVTPSSSSVRDVKSKEKGSDRRCYKCGDQDHLASSCTKGIKCFKCGAFGHVAPQCTATTTFTERKKRGENESDRQPRNNMTCARLVGDVGSADSGGGHDGASRQPVFSLNVNKERKSVKCVEISGLSVESLIDSGSDLNLVTEDLYFELGDSQFTKDNIVLTGLGLSKVVAVGKFVNEVKVDNNCYNATFYIVPRDVMPYKMILGQPFLELVKVIIDRGVISIMPQGESEILGLLADIESTSLSHVPADIRAVAEDLVEAYKPVQVKETPLEMVIILKDNIPVAQRPRRLSAQEQEVVDIQVKEWLLKGIVKPSFSEYASPLVLVKKKNGKTRVCVDYRKVNEKMVKDQFPLPIIDDHLDKLAEATIYTKLDLKDAFFHLKIREDCTKYTSFVTQSGQYEFTKAPFGLAICPNYFTRFINAIFRELLSEGYLLIFIDDIIISAGTYEQGLDRLKQVLQVAAEYGLIINWEKSQLLTTRVEYLGHIVENGTVRPSTDKVEAVMKYPMPRTIKQVQSFVGLTSYFRKFIEGYAVIAKPLTDLLKKDCQFVFTDEHILAFEALKKILSEQPVLKIFNPRFITEMHTDASQEAFAAILLQKDPNDQQLHPVYYMSKKTTKAEEKYTSYELEALAVVEGVKRFRRYLLGIPFKIVTDCLAFEMTLKKRDLSTRVARWVLLLQEYNYTVEHRAGTRMRHVDALSRNPYVGVVTRRIHEQIRRAQEIDDGVKAILDILKEKPYLDYYEQNGLLYKGVEGLLVIPKGLEYEIIRSIHDNGHFGKKKMLEMLNKDFYIKDVVKKIEEVLISCIPCLLAMKKAGKQEGFLNSIDKGDIPLNALHCDHIGPLSETKKLYNYILTVVDGFTKFVWLFPTKTTNSKETIDELKVHQQTWGNPQRVITDRGAAFISNDFAEYCATENIQHVKVTTGVPRGNGQVERIHRIVVSVLTKLCLEDDKLWYRHISRVQRAINSTYQRSIGMSPFELLTGCKMKQKEDVELLSMLEVEYKEYFMQEREDLREKAKTQIFKIQEENRKNFNRKRKVSTKYAVGDYVAVKRTQFGTHMKLKPKFLGPYKVTKVLGRDRYEVIKADSSTEGPNKTTSAADHMKSWPD